MRYDVFVSLVVPLSNDVDILDDVLGEVERVMKEHYNNYEIIFVDDGSLDHTRSFFEERRTTVDCLRYFRLSRTFGLEVAIECGLDHAIGDVVVILRPECDPPQLIPHFVEQAQSCKGIVVGTRNLFTTRSTLYRLVYNIYYKLCQFLLERPQVYCSTHYMGLTRTVLNGILKIRDNHRYLRVLSMYAGYTITTVEYTRIQRRKIDRHRNLFAVIDDVASMICSNSLRPLRQAGAVAAIASLLDLTYLGYVLLMRFFYEGVQPGWAAISFQNGVMFGLLFLIAAVLCEYMARILEEVKDRPLYFIDEERHSCVMLTDPEVRNVVYEGTPRDSLSES